MKRLFLVALLMSSAFCVFAQDSKEEMEMMEQASLIAKKLSLDKKTEHLTYNVIKHIDGRIADVPLGHPNYKKLLQYVDQERLDMMKVILPADKFKAYDKSFSPAEEAKLKALNEKNDAYVKSNGTLNLSGSAIDFMIDDRDEASDSTKVN